MITSKYPVFLFVIFLSSSCSVKQDQSADELIHVDVNKAFDNQKSFKASQFIKDVEFISLEATVDSYFKFSENYSVGRKYILVTDTERAHMILFDRNGIFIRNIGTKGKGPGELGYPQAVTLSPDENFLFVYDSGINKLVKFSVEGEFITEISTKETSPSRYATGIVFINPDQFVLVNRRPLKPMDGFASLTVFDKDLNLVKTLFNRANDENLRINAMPHAVFKANPGRFTFWEPFADTLYTVSPEGVVNATHVIGFSTGGPDRHFVTTNNNSNLYADQSIISIIEAGKNLHIWGKSDQHTWFLALFDSETQESFEVTRENSCFLTTENKPFGFDNDLFAIGDIFFRDYNPQNDCFVSLIDLDFLSEYYDLDCLAQKQVKYSEMRDQMLDYARNPDGAVQKVMVLMKLKK